MQDLFPSKFNSRIVLCIINVQMTVDMKSVFKNALDFHLHLIKTIKVKCSWQKILNTGYVICSEFWCSKIFRYERWVCFLQTHQGQGQINTVGYIFIIKMSLSSHFQKNYISIYCILTFLVLSFRLFSLIRLST